MSIAKWGNPEHTVLNYNGTLVPVTHKRFPRIQASLEEEGVIIGEYVEFESVESFMDAALRAIDKHLDDTAAQYGYSGGIKTAVTYAGATSVPKFQDEGIAFLEWRSLVYDTAYKLAAAGSVNTVQGVIDALPEFSVTYRS